MNGGATGGATMGATGGTELFTYDARDQYVRTMIPS
jgi:hypothetical protein